MSGSITKAELEAELCCLLKQREVVEERLKAFDEHPEREQIPLSIDPNYPSCAADDVEDEEKAKNRGPYEFVDE